MGLKHILERVAVCAVRSNMDLKHILARVAVHLSLKNGFETFFLLAQGNKRFFVDEGGVYREIENHKSF